MQRVIRVDLCQSVARNLFADDQAKIRKTHPLPKLNRYLIFRISFSKEAICFLHLATTIPVTNSPASALENPRWLTEILGPNRVNSN